MQDLVREIEAPMLNVGHFDNRVNALQDWLSSRPGYVCAVLRAGQDGLFCGCTAMGDLPPRAVADRESGLKAPEIA